MSSDNKIIIASIPNISEENPYQKLFYNELKKYNVAIYEDFKFRFLNILKNRKTLNIIHFHWIPAGENGVIKGYLRVFYFAFNLLVCKLFGIKLIWTAHNLMPHDAKNVRLQYLKRFILIHIVDLIIVHFEAAKEKIAKRFHVSSKKMILMPVGLYEGAYKNTISSDFARQKLSIAKGKTVFLYFGRIRRYKNIESLIHAIQKINNENIILLIAGPVDDQKYKDEIESLIMNDKRFVCHFEYIKDDDVQIFFNSADCVVLPYKNIFTSGTAMLALTFNKSVIMKKCDFSCEYLSQNNGIFIDECDEFNLSRGIESFVKGSNHFNVTNDFLSRYRWENIINNFMHDDRVNKILCRK